MRGFVFVLIIAVPGPAMAQAPAFNPYQAVEERRSLEQAEAEILATYGAITDRRDFLLASRPTEGLHVLRTRTNGIPGTFIFCHGVMAGYSAPVTTAVAEAVVAQLTGTGERYEAHAQGLSLVYPNDLLVMYQVAGMLPGHVSLTYPLEVIRNTDATDLCAGYGGKAK